MCKHRILQIMISMIAAIAIFMLPGTAADEQIPQLRVFPEETTGEIPEGQEFPGLKRSSAAAATYATTQAMLDQIAAFEGFSPTPVWDTYWESIGYGSQLAEAIKMFPEIKETRTITREQAMALMRKEIAQIDSAVNSFLSRIGVQVNQNQFDALTSFTYNVGIRWTTYQNSDGTWCKLRVLLEKGPGAWTQEAVSEAFGTWVRDGNGNKLPGLVRRRAYEAELFMTPVADSFFRDVKAGSWYYDAVVRICELGYMTGMSAVEFAPADALTRAQVVTILANMENAELSYYTCGAFRDVTSGAWYCAAVAWAAEKGYVSGFEDGTFRPNERITREQLCSILARYLRKKGFAAGTEAISFSDGDAIAEYAGEAVQYCTSLGLILGMGDGSFSPKSGATRAQAASLFARLHELMNK